MATDCHWASSLCVRPNITWCTLGSFDQTVFSIRALETCLPCHSVGPLDWRLSSSSPQLLPRVVGIASRVYVRYKHIEVVWLCHLVRCFFLIWMVYCCLLCKQGQVIVRKENDTQEEKKERKEHGGEVVFFPCTSEKKRGSCVRMPQINILWR